MSSPVINTLTPNAGPVLGGSIAVIEGEDFQSGAIILFGGEQATGVTLINSTVITCVTPTHAAGAVSVQVTNPDAGQGVKANAFTYQASESAKRNALIGEARNKLADLSLDVPLIEPSVWEQAVTDALLLFSTDYPLRKKTTVEFLTGEDEYQMDGGLLSIDWQSFNRAVNPESSGSSDGFFFDRECTIADRPFSFTASSFAIDHRTRNGVFERNTRFELIDDGAGGKLLVVDPVPMDALTAKFTGEFIHIVGMVQTVDTDTTPAEHRHRLVACIADQALVSLMRDLVDDKDIVAKLEDVSRKLCAVYKRGGRKRRRVSIA